MKLTFLGTASALPSPTRNVTALALGFDQRRGWWLFDCGEGTQHQLLRAPLSPARLDKLFVSHLHGDHCFGIPGLLCTRAMNGATERVDLYGPPGLAAYVASFEATTLTAFPFEVAVHELSHGDRVTDEELTVRAVGVRHAEPAPTLAWVVEEAPIPGRLQVERLRELGVDAGPLYGELKGGATVTTPDGREISGADFVDPPREGRTLALVFDAMDASAIADVARDPAILVHEATYLERTDAHLAEKNRHSTAAAAGRLATRIGARRLALHHFSPRYETGSADPGIADLVAEAAAHFDGEVVAARDLLELAIPLD